MTDLHSVKAAWTNNAGEYAARLDNFRSPENRSLVFARLLKAAGGIIDPNDMVVLEDQGIKTPIPAVKLPVSWERLPVDHIQIIGQAEQLPGNNADPDFIAFLTNTLKKIIINLPVFRLAGISAGGSLHIGMTDYMTAIDRCDKFLYRLVSLFPITGPAEDGFWADIGNMPFFQDWLSSLKCLTEGRLSGTHFGLGCSAPLLFRRRDKGTGEVIYSSFVVVNSHKKNALETYHVSPSFIYQPGFRGDSGMMYTDSNLRDCILREFAEEILGLQETEEVSNNDYVVWAAQADPAMRRLVDLADCGSASMELTGLTFDLLRLRPEISTVLIIDDEQYFEEYHTHFRFNWEAGHRMHGPAVRLVEFRQGQSFAASLQKAGVIGKTLDELPLDFVASGLYSLYKAYEVVQEEKTGL